MDGGDHLSRDLTDRIKLRRDLGEKGVHAEGKLTPTSNVRKSTACSRKEMKVRRASTQQARAEWSDVMVERWRLKYRLWDTLQLTRMGLNLMLSAEVDD